MKKTLIITLLFVSPFIYGEGLADLNGQSSISRSEERKIGTEWWRNNYRQLKPVEDFLLHFYVEDLIARLRQGEELADYELRIRILSSPSFNAFAAPGGVIGINMGLWRLAETEGELAAVLAHELSHLSQRHFIRMLEEARRRNNVSLATALAGLGLILTGNAPAGVLALYGTASYGLESYLETSRRFEREADRQAVVFMERGQFQLAAAASMYRRLLQENGGEEGVEYIRTHPFLAERVSDAQLRANNKKPPAKGKTDYHFARARALGQMNLLDNLPLNTNDLFLQALRLQREGKHKAAAAKLKELSASRPRSQFLFLSYIEALILAREAKEAIELLNERTRYGSPHSAWNYYLALAYEVERDYERAAQQMERVAQGRIEDEHIWKNLWGYYEKLNDEYNILRARMAYRALTGESTGAREDFQLASRAARQDELRLARLDYLQTQLGIY